MKERMLNRTKQKWKQLQIVIYFDQFTLSEQDGQNHGSSSLNSRTWAADRPTHL